MREYEVGDIVRIRDDIRDVARDQSYGFAVVKSMCEAAGKIYTIESIEDSSIYGAYLQRGGPIYYLDRELGGWKWQAFMFDQTFKEEMNEEVISAYSELFEGSERRNEIGRAHV